MYYDIFRRWIKTVIIITYIIIIIICLRNLNITDTFCQFLRHLRYKWPWISLLRLLIFAPIESAYIDFLLVLNSRLTFWSCLAAFYRAMHFSAKRGIAIACRVSVRPSVRPSVTLVNCDHIGWNSSKIIPPLVSLGRSLFATPTWRVCSKGSPKFGPKVTHPLLIWALESFDCKLRPNGYTYSTTVTMESL